MQTLFPTPDFITFTGVDSAELIPGMQKLSARYPIEWGVLINPDQHDNPLFPESDTLQQIQRSGLRLSGHICGEPAMTIAVGGTPTLDLGGFSRIQINHGFQGSSAEQIGNCLRFASFKGIRPALQCQDRFPNVQGVDWLYDVSFGTGAQPKQWIPLNGDVPFCGYSGGLNAENVCSVLQEIDVRSGGHFWIDMESGVRTGGRFDLKKCATVCEAVYGTGVVSDLTL